MISIIVGIADNGVIGQTGGSMPWNQREDLKRFREITMGHPVVMGSTTYGTIGHPLKGRPTFVLSRDPNFEAEGCTVATSIQEALELAGKAEGGEEVFVMGGANVYQQALEYADKIYLTEVHGNPDGDIKFEFDRSKWKEVKREQHKADENNDYDYDYVDLVKL